jgi:hypothetical protein
MPGRAVIQGDKEDRADMKMSNEHTHMRTILIPIYLVRIK